MHREGEILCSGLPPPICTSILSKAGCIKVRGFSERISQPAVSLPPPFYRAPSGWADGAPSRPSRRHWPGTQARPGKPEMPDRAIAESQGSPETATRDPGIRSVVWGAVEGQSAQGGRLLQIARAPANGEWEAPRRESL